MKTRNPLVGHQHGRFVPCEENATFTQVSSPITLGDVSICDPWSTVRGEDQQEVPSSGWQVRLPSDDMSTRSLWIGPIRHATVKPDCVRETVLADKPVFGSREWRTSQECERLQSRIRGKTNNWPQLWNEVKVVLLLGYIQRRKKGQHLKRIQKKCLWAQETRKNRPMSLN